jgi:hypothetical protein
VRNVIGTGVSIRPGIKRHARVNRNPSVYRCVKVGGLLPTMPVKASKVFPSLAAPTHSDTRQPSATQ